MRIFQIQTIFIDQSRNVDNAEIKLHNINCKKDLYHTCIEYKRKENNNNNSNDSNNTKDTHRKKICIDKREHNNSFYLSFSKNNKIMDQIDKIKLNNQVFDYYFVFGCVPTSSWFRIVPE